MVNDIEFAHPEDIPAIIALLHRVGLPPDGLAEHVASTVIIHDGTRVVGSAALEVYGSAALVRSVAVGPELQRTGLGHPLMGVVANLAYERDIAELFLLTTTAQDYFLRFGFQPIARGEVPDAVVHSVQFTTVCPTTATVMRASTQTVIKAMTHFGEEPMNGEQAVKASVRKHYAQAITSNSCCGGACCGSADSTELKLYGAEALHSLPSDVVTTSFGCGNPQAIAALHPAETVLDLGSGGGLDVLLAAQQVGPDGYVYGLDMTDEMLAVARCNAERAGATNVEFVKGEIEDIPLPAGTADVIMSNCVINLSPDKNEVLHEAFRVLKPGGRLAISDIVVDGSLGDMPLAEVQIRAALSWVGCIAGALTIEHYRTLLVEAGFEQIDIAVKHRYSVEDLGVPAGLDGIDAGVLEQLAGRFTSSAITARKPSMPNEI